MGWVHPMGLDTARNPLDPETSSHESACDVLTLSVVFPLYHSHSMIKLQVDTDTLARLFGPTCKGLGEMMCSWGSGVLHTIGSCHPRQRVLDSSRSVNRIRFRGKWSGDQNPTDRYVLDVKNTCESD